MKYEINENATWRLLRQAPRKQVAPVKSKYPLLGVVIHRNGQRIFVLKQ